jgi:mannose-6-phosphate isomerase-like protein (cupin superfamily)
MNSEILDRDGTQSDIRRPANHLGQQNVSAFSREGYLGPVDLCSPAQCDDIIKHLRLDDCPAPLDWIKGRAASDSYFYDLATKPALLAILRPLLGDDIILWGASVAERGSGDVHPWHTDMEAADSEGRFVSVWIGIENTEMNTGLRFITRSHRSAKTVQQVRHEHGVGRKELSDEQIFSWARDRDPKAAITEPELWDGQAIIFDGRLWHGSRNASDKPRTAILLQYMAPGVPVFIPDFEVLDWPFKRTTVQAPGILIAGKERAGLNRLVPPPKPALRPRHMIGAEFHRLALPLAENRRERWQIYPILDGSTAMLMHMSFHASVLSSGYSPHPPHAHAEEELLIVLDGEAELLIGENPNPAEARVVRLGPGSFAYYPAFRHHTIRNGHSSPLTYAMFKWRSATAQPSAPADAEIVNFGRISALDDPHSFSTQLLMEHPTSHLAKLHAHLTHLQPGAGYPAHCDDYDVAILVLDGRIQTLGQEVGPNGLIYCSAGEMHDMRNVGDEVARYLVFEFHAANLFDPQLPWAQQRKMMLAKIQLLQKLCSDLTDQRKALLASRAWRITAPLRASKGLLRRLGGRRPK